MVGTIWFTIVRAILNILHYVWVFLNVAFVESMEKISANVQKLWEALLGVALSAHMIILQRVSNLVVLSKYIWTPIYLGIAMEHQQLALVLKAIHGLSEWQ